MSPVNALSGNAELEQVLVSVHCRMLHLSSYKQNHQQNVPKSPFICNFAFISEELSCCCFK